MRDDFLAYCSHQESLNPIFSELTPLKPLSGAAIRRALLQPALKCGYRFEDDSLVDEMVEEVSGERGALPLLAFAASRLWDHRDRDQGLLTREAYEHIGGVGGALAQHAEQTLEKIGQDQIPIVRELFRNLVTAQGTRAARDRQELLSVFDGLEDETKRPVSVPAGEGGATGEREVAAQVLDTLIDARLLTSYEVPAADEGDPPHHRIEIIHESLLSNWPRLVRWQTQDADSAQLRDQIRQVAQMWEERGRPEDLLWTGTSFGEYRLWRERYEGGLSTAEEDFGDAMVHRAERQKRRRRMAISAAFGVLLAVLGVIAYFGWQAELERRRAEAGKLIALGELELQSYPTAALAWATESLEIADTLEARLLALRALQQAPPATIFGEVNAIHTFSPNGEWFATSSIDGVKLRAHDGREPIVVAGGVGVFASDEVLVTEEEGDLRWWSVPEAKELRRSDGERGELGIGLARDDGYFSVTREGRQRSIHWWPFEEGASRLMGAIGLGFGFDIDPSGAWLAYPREKALYLRSLEDWSLPPRRLGEHTEIIQDVAYHPGGGRVAAIDKSGEIRVWPTAGDSTEPLRRLQASEKALIKYHPSGSWLAGGRLVEGRPVIWLWDLTAPQGTDPLRLQRTDAPTSWYPEFHPSKPWVVMSYGGTIAFWPLANRYPWTLRGHEGHVSKVAFTTDGEWLISAGQLGVRVWPLQGQEYGAARILVQRRVGRAAFDAARERLAVGTEDGTILIVPLDGSPTREVAAGQEWGLVALSADGRHLATVPGHAPAEEMLVRVWDLESGEVRALGAVTGWTSQLDFIDDDHLRWIGEGDEEPGGGERIFDLESGSMEVRAEQGSELSRATSKSGSFTVSIDGRIAPHHHPWPGRIRGPGSFRPLGGDRRQRRPGARRTSLGRGAPHPLRSPGTCPDGCFLPRWSLDRFGQYRQDSSALADAGS
jgi:WD40 repeat protein